MGEGISGKLELLFAHLSLNTVPNVTPLLMEAIDEYQNIRSSLTYDQKSKVNLIKTLLWHVERGDWHEARENLKGAERAYQDYMRSKATDLQNHKTGYAQIHGKRNSQLAILPPDRHINTPDKLNYMFKGDEIEREQHFKSQTPAVCNSASSRRINLWSASNRRNRKPETPSEYDEQGPDKPLKRQGYESRCHQQFSDYPGRYVKQKTEAMNAVQTVKTLSDNNSRTSDNDKQLIDPDLEQNRPSKIADAFFSLYNDEWRHALTSLKNQAIMEETAIECLLYILTESYRLCLDEAKLQVLEFENAALNIITNGRYTYHDKGQLGETGNIKHMIEYRKEVSDLALKRLQDQFLMRTLPLIHRRYGVKDDTHIDMYARQCISITWKMSIQDPVFYINSNLEEYTEFDSKLYKPYRKSGDRVRFLVWPVLRLYENGPVLSRGIAQGSGHGDNSELQ